MSDWRPRFKPEDPEPQATPDPVEVETPIPDRLLMLAFGDVKVARAMQKGFQFMAEQAEADDPRYAQQLRRVAAGELSPRALLTEPRLVEDVQRSFSAVQAMESTTTPDEEAERQREAEERAAAMEARIPASHLVDFDLTHFGLDAAGRSVPAVVPPHAREVSRQIDEFMEETEEE